MIINDDGLRRALLKALADEYASRIIASTVLRPKSVAELIRECGIPHTTAYRIVNELKEKGILTVERIIHSRDGKKTALYRSTFRNILIKFEGGFLEVEATPNRDIVDKAFKLFYSLKGEEAT